MNYLWFYRFWINLAAPQQNSNKFGFVLGLHYVAFGEDRLRLGIANKKNDFLFVTPLGLHYLCP